MTWQYQKILKKILGEGDVQYEPRTEEYILGISGSMSTYDLRNGIPLVTTKKLSSQLPFEELFWKLRGERNVKPLVDRNVNIWTANAFDRHLRTKGLEKKFPKHTPKWNSEFEDYSKRIKSDKKFANAAGDLGPVYGYNWRNDKDSKGNNIDQLTNAISGIKDRPGSRYHVLSSWNVSRLSDMAIGPCPFWHQFSVFGNKFLDLTVVQRSNDIFLGVPFNLDQDALFLEMMAAETGLIPRYFHHQTINTHAYLGVAPRADFWMEEKNVKEFQERFRKIRNRDGYLELKEWYSQNSPSESEGNERKDHIPFILEQLSHGPKKSPKLNFIQEIPFMEAIQLPPLEVVEIEGYVPHKWDSKAVMAS